MEYPCFEIGLSRIGAHRLSIRVEYTHPNRDALKRVEEESDLDMDRLLSVSDDDLRYGRELERILFGSRSVKEAFASARDDCDKMPCPLRLRLAVSALAPELQTVNWERVLAPESDERLAASQRILFSRLTTSSAWRETRPRALAGMKALVVIASPADAETHGVWVFDGEAFRAAAQDQLASATIQYLGLEEPATLEMLLSRLREGFDLLYLVCHGAVADDEPILLLHTSERNGTPVRGADLVRQCREIQHLPRLVILASCNSAGDAATHGSSQLVRLAPRIAEAGVASVLGFHGNVHPDTAHRFCKKFFESLRNSGDVEVATSVGRAEVGTRDDWWSPSLLTRLRTGLLWYRRGFASASRAGSASETDTWSDLMSFVLNRNVTPLVGSSVFISPLGTRRELAQRWAAEFNYPLVSGDRLNATSLPQVAQYVAVKKGDRGVRNELLKYAYTELLSADHEHTPIDPRFLNPEEVVEQLTKLIAERLKDRREADAQEPYSVIARLRAPVFVTLDYTDQLYDALVAEGKQPTRQCCIWSPTDARASASARLQRAKTICTEQRPLVFHMFGRLEEPDSMVLTEDNYFDFLVGSSSGKDLIPPEVSSAFCKNALMFVGCNLNEWDFRTLLRVILSQRGFRKEDFHHFAVNVDPEDSGLFDPPRARAFFQNYLYGSNKIEIFWGTAVEFLRELDDRLKNYPGYRNVGAGG